MPDQLSTHSFYAVGVVLGPDGTHDLKVMRPSGERIFSASVIGSHEGFRLSMERATEAMWKDVREGESA